MKDDPPLSKLEKQIVECLKENRGKIEITCYFCDKDLSNEELENFQISPIESKEELKDELWNIKECGFYNGQCRDCCELEEHDPNAYRARLQHMAEKGEEGIETEIEDITNPQNTGAKHRGLTKKEEKTADRNRRILNEKLDSCAQECESFSDLEVVVEAVSPAGNCITVRAPSEIHIGDPAKYAFNLDAAIDVWKGTKFELFFSEPLGGSAFWSYMAKIVDLPMTLRVFLYPAPKKTKWYQKQKPNSIRYVLIDSQGIPHFADFEGIPYKL